MDALAGVVGALEVGVRLLFVFIILGLATAAVSEAIASLWRLRARNLERAIVDLLDDPSKGGIRLAPDLLAHPLFRARERGGIPAYISSAYFRAALLDTLAARSERDPIQVRQADPAAVLATLPPKAPLRRALEVLAAEANADPTVFGRQIERWFLASMGAARANYRAATQTRLFMIAIVLTILANVNTFSVLAAVFADRAATTPPPPPSVAADAPVQASTQTNQPQHTVAAPRAAAGSSAMIGWDSSDVQILPQGTPPVVRKSLHFIIDHVVGWLLSAVMIAVLAVVSFDVLSRYSGRTPSPFRRSEVADALAKAGLQDPSPEPSPALGPAKRRTKGRRHTAP